MEIHEKIRILRELAQWSQEEMAERLNMSLSGYAKIERGENQLNLRRLQQIAEVFEIDLTSLVDTGRKGFVFLFNENCPINENHTHSNNHYSGGDAGKLAMVIAHKDDIIAHKNEIIAMQAEQIEQQKEMIALLKEQKSC